MNLEKLKNTAVLVAAALAVSFGLGWGFSHFVNRASRREAQRNQKQAQGLQALVRNREQTKKEVNRARATLAASDPDLTSDSLFP